MKKNNQNYNLDFWTKRAKKYNKLEWVQNKIYLKKFIKVCDFKKSDVVLDVGTGTGIIAYTISPFVKKVIGLDKSEEMLKQAPSKKNIHYIKGNILHLSSFFTEETFDKITARHVFHHILYNTQRAMDECYKVLKKGGKMILSEGVPPDKRVREDYIRIFRLKEKRLTFLEEDLEKLMKRSGFKNIKTEIVILRRMSIRNWLMNSGLPIEKQRQIFLLHVNSNNYFKKAYNLKITRDDCLVNFKMVILIGEK